MMPHIPFGLLPGPREAEDPRRRRQGQPNGNPNSNGGGNGGGHGLLAPFMPGDQAMLAQQMNAGFGGDPQAIAQYLQRLYSPMKVNFNYRNIGTGGGFGGRSTGQSVGGPYGMATPGHSTGSPFA